MVNDGGDLRRSTCRRRTARCGSGGTPMSRPCPRARSRRCRRHAGLRVGRGSRQRLSAGRPHPSVVHDHVEPAGSAGSRLHVRPRNGDPQPDPVSRTPAARWSSARVPSSGRGGSTRHTIAAATPPVDFACSRPRSTCWPTWASQPATLQPGLTSPTRVVGRRRSGIDDHVAVYRRDARRGPGVTVAGTASDTAGMVGGVKVSTDGGTTWLPAQGRETWTYNWTPSSVGSVTLKTRAVDDSGNLGPHQRARPSRLRPNLPMQYLEQPDDSATVSDPDTAAVELGDKFRTDVDGFVTGLRFYKGSANTGTHVGHLWTSGGHTPRPGDVQRRKCLGLAAGPLRQSGGDRRRTRATWFPTTRRTAATRRTTAISRALPSTTAADSAPRRQDGPNSIYKYGASGSFPDQRTTPANYWVDVVFVTDVGPDNTAPTVLSVSPGDGAAGIGTSANVTVTFSEGIAESSLTGNFEVRDWSGASSRRRLPTAPRPTQRRWIRTRRSPTLRVTALR